MFRCKKCKSWLKSTTLDTTISNENNRINVKNIPAKICLNCGEIYIYDIVKDNAFKYALQKGVNSVDYMEYEAEESVASQNIL